MNSDLEDLDEIADMISEAKGSSPKKKLPKNYSREIKVTKPQNQFLNFSTKEKRDELVELCFSGGVGSGKSYALCLQLLKYIQVPGTVVLLVHKHLSMLKRTTLPLLINGTVSKNGDFIEPLLGTQFIENFNKSDSIIKLTNGSKIILSGCMNEERLKSLNITSAFIDELTNLSRESYQSIVQRCRVFNKNPNGVFSCTNPSSKNHWCYKHFVNESIPNYREIITVNSWSNKENLPEAYLKNLERLPELERRKQLEGQWINLGNQVFYAFNVESHVRDLSNWKPEDYESFIIGQDLGGGGKNSYSGACLIGVTSTNKYHVLEEFTKTATSHSEILKWMEQYRDISNSIVVFDSANQCMKHDLENQDWKAIPSIKDVEGSVVKCNSLFSENLIIVSKKCENLIKQLDEAFRDPNTEKINKLKGWDVIDSFRYALCAITDNSLMDKNSGSGGVFVFSL